MQKYLFKNIEMVNEGKIEHADVLIHGERIEKIGPHLDVKGNVSEIDGAGKHLLPGVIDDQVHFREPGLTHKATIYTESKAAIAGGVTSFMEMPNTIPNALTLDLLEEKYKTAAQTSLANYSFFMGVSNDNAAEVLRITEHKKNMFYHGYKQFLFGIVQGANNQKMREESARAISSMDFDGIAIGGESVGYNMEATKNILDWVNPIIPEDKPHYTMGLGSSPMDLFEVVERGVDMFDCVSPTRIARNGTMFVKSAGAKNKYRININNAQFKNDKKPIDPECICSTCVSYSRAYIHHLFDTKELLSYKLATIHNLHFFLNLMKNIRAAIKENKFLELKEEWKRL